MVLFIFHKLILRTHMGSLPVGPDVWFLVRPLVYFHTSCGQTAKALVRLHRCADSLEPSLVAYVIFTIISFYNVLPKVCQPKFLSFAINSILLKSRLILSASIFIFFFFFWLQMCCSISFIKTIIENCHSGLRIKICIFKVFSTSQILCEQSFCHKNHLLIGLCSGFVSHLFTVLWFQNIP